MVPGGVRVRRAPRSALLHRHGVRRGRLARAPHRRRTHGAARWRSSTPLCICEFLDKAHQFLTIEGEPGNPIVHADLKPQHILLPRPGEIRVLDFGIAKALAKTRQVTTNIWGTIYYASPEQLESGGVNPYVDFWSLGVMLYEMVAGHRPYAHLEKNSRQLERAIRTNERREPLPDSCPPPLAAIINKLLAYQPERRYPTAAAIRADLEAFLVGPRAGRRRPNTTRRRPTTIDRPPLPLPAQSPADLVPPTDPLPLTGVTPRIPLAHPCDPGSASADPVASRPPRAPAGSAPCRVARDAALTGRPCWPSKAWPGWRPSASGRRLMRSTGRTVAARKSGLRPHQRLGRRSISGCAGA